MLTVSILAPIAVANEMIAMPGWIEVIHPQGVNSFELNQDITGVRRSRA